MAASQAPPPHNFGAVVNPEAWLAYADALESGGFVKAGAVAEEQVKSLAVRNLELPKAVEV